MKQEIKSVTIGIAVNEAKEASLWFKSLLGDVETMEPAPGTIELKVTDNAWLQLDDTGYIKPGGSIVRFETTEIEIVHASAKRIAKKTTDIETVEGVVKYFDFEDLSGNQLSYYQIV